MSDTDEGVERLFRALRGAVHDPAVHEHWQGLIPSLVQAEMGDEPLLPRFAQLLEHLETCEECTVMYAVLLDLAMLDERQALPEPPIYPPLQFRAIGEHEDFPGYMASSRQRLQTLAQRVAGAILDAVNPQAARFLPQAAATLARRNWKPAIAESSSDHDADAAQAALLGSYQALDLLLQAHSAGELHNLAGQGRLEDELRRAAGLAGLEPSLVEPFAQQLLANVDELEEVTGFT